MHNPPKIGELLLQTGIIDELQLQAALAEQDRWGHRLGVTLIKMGMVDENDLVLALAEQLGLPATSLSGRRIAPEVIALVPERVASEHCVIPLFVQRRGKVGKLFLGMEDPSNLEVLDDLCFRTGLEMQPVMMGPTDLGIGIDRYYVNGGVIRLGEANGSASEHTMEERFLGLDGSTRTPNSSLPQVREESCSVHPIERTQPFAMPLDSRDNELSLAEIGTEVPRELMQAVDKAVDGSETARLVVRALTQLLIEKRLISNDEVQSRLDRFKGSSSKA